MRDMVMSESVSFLMLMLETATHGSATGRVGLAVGVAGGGVGVGTSLGMIRNMFR